MPRRPTQNHSKLSFVGKEYDKAKYLTQNSIGQGRSQNLKEITQNFTEVFNIDDVTANEVIQRNQHRKGNKIKLSFIVITDVKLASYLKKDLFFISMARTLS